MYVMAMVLFAVVGTMVYMKKMVDNLNEKKGGRGPGPGQVDYKVREGPPPADPVTGEPEKKQIPVPPLPQDGRVSFRDLAAPFQDGEEKVVKETPEFINVLNVFLNSVTPESASKLVNPALTADLAYLDPAKHRGEFVRSYGRLIQIYTERMGSTTPNNVEFVYLGIMQEYPTNRTVYFYMPEMPKDPATGKPIEFSSYHKRGEEYLTDWVEVEGMFLRQYAYPSQYEDDRGRVIHARAAVLFVKNIRPVKKPEFSDPRGGFIFIVGGLAVLVVVIVVVAGVMSRKYSSGSLRMRLFALKKQKTGAAPVPPPSPEKQILGDEVSASGAAPKPPADPPAGA
jgi:hypothetical protein